MATTYNTQGLPEKFTSYDAATSGSVVNEVQRAYNGLGQIITEHQAHGGAVNTGSSPKVEYAYTEMASGANHSRLKSMTYPNGRILRYEYTSGLDSDLSRISYLADDSSGSVGTHLEEYSYLGAGTIVRRNRPEPGVELTYIKQGAEPVGDAGDQYTGLDRFGRIEDQRWLDTSSGGTDHTDRWTYAYDRNSNPLYKDNKLQSTMSELYHANSGSSGDNNTAYDKLNRLTDFRRGTLSSSGNNGPGLDTVSSASRTQGWSLDTLGNSTSVSTNGTPQSRTHNSKNQATVVGGNNLVFDNAGNTTTDESGKQHVYDAWNRLVESKASAGAGGASLVTHAYDALMRRTKESPNAGTATDFYYTASWQIAEEQQSGTTKSQFVWGLSYIDDLVIRDKDADNSSGTGSLGKAGSGLEQRIYVQQDANHNVTALVNTSGTVLQRFVYDPYGVSTVLAANWSGTTDGYQWHERHQGTRWEPIADLHVIRWRFYSANRMGWMQEDSEGYIDGANLYSPLVNSPLRYVDPWGENVMPGSPGTREYEHAQRIAQYERDLATYKTWVEAVKESLKNGTCPAPYPFVDNTPSPLPPIEAAYDGPTMQETTMEEMRRGQAAWERQKGLEDGAARGVRSSQILLAADGDSVVAFHMALKEAMTNIGSRGRARAMMGPRVMARPCPPTATPPAQARGQGPQIHSRYGDGTPVYKGQEPPRISGPDPAAQNTPHSVLRSDPINNRTYQAREFGQNNVPTRDVDFTNPTFPNGTVRPGHPGPPHQHRWIPNDLTNLKAGHKRGPAEPMQ